MHPNFLRKKNFKIYWKLAEVGHLGQKGIIDAKI